MIWYILYYGKYNVPNGNIMYSKNTGKYERSWNMFAFIYIKKPVAANAVNLYHQINDMLGETFGARHLTWIPELNGGDIYKNSLYWMVKINKIIDSCQEFLKQNQKVDERARTPWVLWSILGSAPRYVKTPAEAQRDSAGGRRSHAWFWSHGRQWFVSGNWNWDVDDVDTFHWNHL